MEVRNGWTAVANTAKSARSDEAGAARRVQAPDVGSGSATSIVTKLTAPPLLTETSNTAEIGSGDLQHGYLGIHRASD